MAEIILLIALWLFIYDGVATQFYAPQQETR